MTFNRPRPGNSIFSGRALPPQPETLSPRVGIHPPLRPPRGRATLPTPSARRKTYRNRVQRTVTRRYGLIQPPPAAVQRSSASPMLSPGPWNGSGKTGSRRAPYPCSPAIAEWERRGSRWLLRPRLAVAEPRSAATYSIFPSGAERPLLADPVEPLSFFRSPQTLLGLAVIGLTTEHLVVLPDRGIVLNPISIGFSQAEVVGYQAGDGAIVSPRRRLKNSVGRRWVWSVGDGSWSNRWPLRLTGGLGTWKRGGGIRTWRARRPAGRGGRGRVRCWVIWRG
jgi:hypothetical protein